MAAASREDRFPDILCRTTASRSTTSSITVATSLRRIHSITGTRSSSQLTPPIMAISTSLPRSFLLPKARLESCLLDGGCISSRPARHRQSAGARFVRPEYGNALRQQSKLPELLHRLDGGL